MTVLGSDDNGLGSPIQRLSAEQLDRFQQYTYAAGVLYVLNLGLTKISVLLLIHEITPRKGQKVAIRSVLGFTALWTISSVLALFFQCHTPQTWRFIDNQCIDRVSRRRKNELCRNAHDLADWFLGLLYRRPHSNRVHVDITSNLGNVESQIAKEQEIARAVSVLASHSVSQLA